MGTERRYQVEHGTQVKRLASYLKSGETDTSEFKVGMEIEHLIIDSDTLESFSYNENFVKELCNLGWEAIYEGPYILALEKGDTRLTFEPGGQLEIDIAPQKCLENIENIYLSLLKEIIPVLAKDNKALISCGYLPQSSISDITLLPKKRYEYMYEYFKTRQAYAHNMMKGTASTQVCLDYCSEEDYIKKFRVASFLSPIAYFLFDNAPFFEGTICTEGSARYKIWNNCDSDRCGIVCDAFRDGFGFEAYAAALLNSPPILVKRDSELHFTGSTPLKELFNPETVTDEEIDHILSMYFFDVRTRKYIEIRMCDSLPYPYSLACAAFWKGLLYNCRNLRVLFEKSLELNDKGMENLANDIYEKGINATVLGTPLLTFIKEIVNMAKKGLPCCERDLISVIQCMLEKGLRPKDITLKNIERGKAEALKWCIMDETKCTGRCDNIACC
jgi:glutamate--cysteine ligase